MWALIVFYFLLTASTLSQKETIGDLLIVNGQLRHAGIYACTAQTVVDSTFTSARLVVRGKGVKGHVDAEGLNWTVYGYRRDFECC